MKLALKLAPLRIIGAALLASCYVGWCASPAQATFPGANGKLVMKVSGLATLETLNLDGTGEHRLGNDGEDPAWSPDGGRIAFAANGQLHVINGNGTHNQNLGVNGYGPGWSPDGTRIVFYNNGIHVVNADGSDPVQLTNGSDIDPSWSPDGTTIAFSRYDLVTGNASLWLMDADGGNERMIYDAPNTRTGGVDWAPDGSRLVIHANDFVNAQIEIWAVDPDGQNAVQLTSGGAPVPPGSMGPAFSPDGTKIAFSPWTGEGVWTMNVDGTNKVRQNRRSGFDIDWQPLRVGLNVSKRIVPYDGAVKLTMHLYSPVTTNGVVTVFSTPYGEPTQLFASGGVDAVGNFSTTVHPKKRISFYATWSGDAGHPGGGITQPVTVRVVPRLRGVLTHFDSRAGKYRLYNYARSCTNQGHGCPTYSVSLTPSHAGKKLHFQLQLFYRGRWRDALRYKRELPRNGKLVEIFVYGNASIVGLPTRVRSYFDGDVDHLPVKTRWSYFKVI
jgi:TolB protein